MTLSENLQASDFSFLIEHFLIPELSIARYWAWKSSYLEKRRSLAARFEVVGWLLLGVQVGFFEEAKTETILNHFAPELLAESNEMASLFPELNFLVQNLRTDTGFRIQYQYQYQFTVTTEIFLQFRSALLVGAAFARDVVTYPYTTALAFTSDAQWKDLITSDRIEPEEILRLLQFSEDEPLPMTSETVIAGFIRSLRYMDRFRRIVMRPDGFAADRDLAEFQRRIRRIIGWRVNLRDRRTRFDEIGRIVNTKLQTELSKFQSKEDNFFLSELEELAKTWLGDSHFEEPPRAASVRC